MLQRNLIHSTQKLNPPLLTSYIFNCQPHASPWKTLSYWGMVNYIGSDLYLQIQSTNFIWMLWTFFTQIYPLFGLSLDKSYGAQINLGLWCKVYSFQFFPPQFAKGTDGIWIKAANWIKHHLTFLFKSTHSTSSCKRQRQKLQMGFWYKQPAEPWSPFFQTSLKIRTKMRHRKDLINIWQIW